ncbi:MAG TPA: TIGR04086 family membrane protein [Negativicutes bacterium]|jgi:putative membrane protein (TIGR04086 family)
MAKINKRTRLSKQPEKVIGAPILIFRGVLVSLTVSLVCIIFLSLISLASESMFIDHYLQYIMVAVTMISIFVGSVRATQRSESKGLLIGVAIGIIYVLISIGIGMELGPDSLATLVLANKFMAGIAAGALGGLVGVNL